jgi:hypothetical protein
VIVTSPYRQWDHRVVPLDGHELTARNPCEHNDCSRAATYRIMYRHVGGGRPSGTTVEHWCTDHARAFAALNDVSCPPPNEPSPLSIPFRRYESVWLTYPQAPRRSVTVIEDDGGELVTVQWTTTVPDRFWPRADPRGRHNYAGRTHTQHVARDRLTRGA